MSMCSHFSLILLDSEGISILCLGIMQPTMISFIFTYTQLGEDSIAIIRNVFEFSAIFDTAEEIEWGRELKKILESDISV